MIELVATEDGVLLSVKAHPGGRRNEIRGEHDGAIKVSVSQVAEKGRANAAIIELLAEALEVSRSQITLATGTTARRKQFLVRGLTLEDLRQRVEAAIHQSRC